MTKPSSNSLRALALMLLLASFLSQLEGIAGAADAAKRWTNSLGMVFVPVPGTSVAFSIWETRVKDYAAYAAAASGVEGSWSNALYHGLVPVSPGSDYPVVNVSWTDAKGFCAWLTQREHQSGVLPGTALYRLPTDLEWSAAVGIAEREVGVTPRENNKQLKDVFPWGSQWPPPPRVGNFGDAASKRSFTNWTVIESYDDGFATAAPVGSFQPNELGLYDLAGNAEEWCEDWYDQNQKKRVLRGGSWVNHGPASLFSSARSSLNPGARGVICGFRCVLSGYAGVSSQKETKKAGADAVYLFSTFHEPAQDGLRFAYSFDGYHWTNVPGTFLKPEVGAARLMRDPSLLRGPDGMFHLVWTCGWRTDQGFGYASSKDLVHWSEQRFIPVMTNEPTTVNVWAPELFYDDRENQFFVIWSSTIPGRYPDNLEPHTNNHRAYYTTTRDFKTFAPTKLFFEPGYSVIDGFLIKDGPRYVFVHKDNTRPRRNLRVAVAETPLGPWGEISEPFTDKFTEGPCALKIGEDWLIYFDAYQTKTYGAVKTRDFKTFVDITKDVSFPEGHKHGTALRVQLKVLDYLLKEKTGRISR